MTKDEYLEAFDWNNFHYRCSVCNMPIEHGKEDYHTLHECASFITESKEDEISYAEKRELGIVMGNKLRLDILYEQRGRCHDCGVEEWRLKKRLHAHRLQPGKHGGKYVYGNLVLLCHKCHSKRHAEMRRSKRNEINLPAKQ